MKCAGVCGKYFNSKSVKDDVEGKNTRSYCDWRCNECFDVPSSHSSISNVINLAISNALCEFLRI